MVDTKLIRTWYDENTDFYIDQWDKKEKNTRKIFEIPHFSHIVEKFSNSYKILDLGCGNCRFYFSIQGLNKTSYFGIDASWNLLRMAKVKDAEINVTQGDAFKLPFKSNSFDAAVSIGMFEFVHDPVSVINEVIRVTKPGGNFIFNAHNKWVHKPLNMVRDLFKPKKTYMTWKAQYDPRSSKVSSLIGRGVLVRYYYSLPVVILLKLFHGKLDNWTGLLVVLQKIDKLLNKIPVVKYFAATNIYYIRKE